MKKYVKPAIFMESFEMTEHIAQCGINHSDDNSWGFKAGFYADACSFSLGDYATLFVSAACEKDGVLVDPEDPQLGDMGLCYQGVTSTSSNTIFGS